MSKETDAKIDQIVDDLVADDTVAQQLKSKLHKQVDPKSGRFSTPETGTSKEKDDDLWDNVPI
jgi:hypothetical protein